MTAGGLPMKAEDFVQKQIQFCLCLLVVVSVYNKLSLSFSFFLFFKGNWRKEEI